MAKVPYRRSMEYYIYSTMPYGDYVYKWDKKNIFVKAWERSSQPWIESRATRKQFKESLPVLKRVTPLYIVLHGVEL